MNVYGRMGNSDYWILLGRGQDCFRDATEHGRWDLVSIGDAPPNGGQTIGRKLGYVN